MATNNTDPAGITYTYDAGVNHTEGANSNAGLGFQFPGVFSTLNNPYGQAPADSQTNWFSDDALLNDEDLFGAFMHSSPKSHSFSNTPFPNPPAAAEQNAVSNGYCDPRQFLEGAADHNIDPLLRRLSTTNSPRHSDRVSAAASAEQYHGDQSDWNLPPIGHSFWKTFPFQDYMTAAGIQIDTVPAVPVQEPQEVLPDATTYPNIEPFKNPFPIDQGTFGFPQAQDYSQYGQPDYFSRVPGYGLAPDNTTNLPGNPTHFNPFQDDPLKLNPYQFTFPQPTNGQVPIGGNTQVENWIPSSVNPFGNGGAIIGGSQTALPDQAPTKPVTVPERRRSSANPPYDSGTSSGLDSPSITPSPKATEAGKGGTIACSRTLAQIKAVRLAQEIYKPRPKPGPLTIESLGGKKRYKFTYNRNAELRGVFTVNELKAYIMHRFAAATKGSDAQMLIQCVPADSNDRYPTKHVSDKCRFANCIVANRTIKQGTFRVALDEEVDKKLKKRYDPFHAAGFVHLYCLEHFIDLAEIAQKCAIVPDNRKLDARVEGDSDVSRIHLNKTSASNVRTANDFIVALKSGLKQATGFDGKPFDYNKTLCWKLTRNATVDSKELRQFNAKKRGGINIFVHFNDEKRKIELHEMKNKMKNDSLFGEQMGEIMDATIQEAKRDARLEKGLPSSELLSSPDSSSLAKRREGKRTIRNKLVVSLEDARRRSSRLNQTPSPVVSSNQGRKRSLSDADAQGDEDQSPRTLRPVKRTKLNQQQPASNTAEKQRRATLDVYDPAAFNFPTQPQSSSGLPMPAQTKIRPQLRLQMPAAWMNAHQEESSPLSPPPPTPIVHSPNMGRKRSRQDSVADSLFG